MLTRENKIGCVAFLVFFGGLLMLFLLGCWFPYTENTENIVKNDINYESYEEACDDGDFQAAHNILINMKKELRNAIKEAQAFEKDNELVKEVGEEFRLFKKNKTIYDTSNRDKYEGMVEECLGLAEQYLYGIIYVYDEEIRMVDVNYDEEKKTKKIEILKGQRITELKFLTNLYLRDTWNQNCFLKIIEKVNELLEDYEK